MLDTFFKNPLSTLFMGFLLLSTSLYAHAYLDAEDIYCKITPGGGIGGRTVVEFADAEDDFNRFRMCVFADGSMIGINELRFGVVTAKAELDFSTMALLFLSKRVTPSIRESYSIERGLKFCKASGLTIHEVKPATPADNEKLKRTLNAGTEADRFICLEGGPGYLTSLTGAVGLKTIYLGVEADLGVNNVFFSNQKQSPDLDAAYNSIRHLVGHEGDYNDNVIATCDQTAKNSIELSAINITILGNQRTEDDPSSESEFEQGLRTSNRLFLPYRINTNKEQLSSRIIWKPGASFLAGFGGTKKDKQSESKTKANGKKFETSIIMSDGAGDGEERWEYTLTFAIPDDEKKLYSLTPGILTTRKSYNHQVPDRFPLACRIQEKGWRKYFK